jgi:hypothetical protein
MQDRCSFPRGLGQDALGEALVARHVEDVQAVCTQVEGAEAPVARDAAGLLLRQVVPVDAGQGFHRGGLATADAPEGGQDRPERLRPSAPGVRACLQPFGGHRPSPTKPWLVRLALPRGPRLIWTRRYWRCLGLSLDGGEGGGGGTASLSRR